MTLDPQAAAVLNLDTHDPPARRAGERVRLRGQYDPVRDDGMIDTFFLMDGVLDRTAALIEETAHEAARILTPPNKNR